MYSRKDTCPNYLEFSKSERLAKVRDLLGLKNPTCWVSKGKICLESCFDLFKKNDFGQLEKRQQNYLGVKTIDNLICEAKFSESW